MHRLFPRLALFSLLGLPAAPLLAQSDNPLLISAEDRCAFERVDDDSLPMAIEVCEEAANGGDLRAQFELGQLYYRGERVERNYASALNWLEKASIQGQPQAQYRLGMMHFQGEGVTRNLPQAYIILKMAAVNGSNEAMDAADLVALQMNEQETQVANHVLGTLFRDYLAQIQLGPMSLHYRRQLTQHPFQPVPFFGGKVVQSLFSNLGKVDLMQHGVKQTLFPSQHEREFVHHRRYIFAPAALDHNDNVVVISELFDVLDPELVVAAIGVQQIEPAGAEP